MSPGFLDLGASGLSTTPKRLRRSPLGAPSITKKRRRYRSGVFDTEPHDSFKCQHERASSSQRTQTAYLVRGQEAERYYRGLPSEPVLIARSSTTPWDIPHQDWRLRKISIRSHLYCCQLVSVDREHMPQGNVAQGQGVVDQCLDTLRDREFGVDNVECEMMATSWFTLTNPSILRVL